MAVFLFTDIEGSTSLWQKYPVDMGAILARHDELLSRLIMRHGGRVVKSTGDGFFAIFEKGEPLSCVLEIQKQVACQDWSPSGELRVRTALHTGEAVARGDDYFGLDINRTARLLTAGWGGQILLTCELARTAPLPPEAEYQDLGIHILKDLSEPQHIFALIHPDLPVQTFPPLRTLSTHPHNLPPQSTPFVGRADELNEITRRLSEPTCRLLTLTGPGGMGKTRLALQVAAGLVDSFRHGVFFTPLAPLASNELIVPAIAEALRFTFYQRGDPKTQLLDYIREKNILLVLDNFEHLIPAAGLVSEILAAAPQAKVLATSRERLNLHEENIYAVEGMRFPTPDQMGGLADFSSVKLFLQSARRALPGFELVPEEEACIAHICELVRGTPLGIELAAGWLRSLSCREIAREIEASLDFLETSLRDVPDRHRSLRAVFDYSWKLLTENERQLLKRLSIFQAPFPRDAAEAVADTASRQMLLRQLAALVDKSLVRHNTDGTYELHTMLRQFAGEARDQEPATAARTRDLHAAYFIDFLSDQETALQGKNQPEALRRLASCLDDVRIAWLWSLRQQNWRLAERGLPGLSQFFSTCNRDEEWLLLSAEAHDLLEQGTHADVERLALQVEIRSAGARVALNRFEDARPALEAGLEQARRLGLYLESAMAATHLATIAWISGDYTTATRYDQESLETYTRQGKPRGMATCFDRLGISAWSMGDYDSARRFFEQGLDILRREGDPASIARTLDHLGVAHRDSGNPEAARSCFEESKALLEKVHTPFQLAFVLNHLAGLDSMAGRIDEAIRGYEQGIVLSRDVGDRRALAYNLLDLGNILYSNEKDPEHAAALYNESLSIFEMIGERFGAIIARNGRAMVAVAAGDPAAGLAELKRSLNDAIEIQNTRLITYSLVNYADLLYRQERLDEAAEIASFILADKNLEEGTASNNRQMLEEIRRVQAGDVFNASCERGRNLTLDAIRSRLDQE